MRSLFVTLLFVFVFLELVTCAYAQYFSSPPNVLLNNSTMSATTVMGNYNQIIDDGNIAFNAFAAQIAAISGGGVPAKAIVPFNLAACPPGWVPADGTGGTPDMRGYFARATGGSPAVGTFQSYLMTDHSHQIFGTYIFSLHTTGSNFNSGGVGRATSTFQTSIGAMNSGRSATETRPRNVALLYCMKS